VLVLLKTCRILFILIGMKTLTNSGIVNRGLTNNLNGMMTTKSLLTLTEACERLGVTRKTVVVLIENGSIRAFDASPRSGRRLWRVRADSVAAFIATRSVGGGL
jgi:excisionase family DNA binding protein